MEWWQDFGAMLQFMPGAPGLAFDMSVNGPRYQPFGLSLAYNMQNSQTPLNVYPPEGVALPEEE